MGAGRPFLHHWYFLPRAAHIKDPQINKQTKLQPKNERKHVSCGHFLAHSRQHLFVFCITNFWNDNKENWILEIQVQQKQKRIKQQSSE